MRPNIILILADDMGYSDIGCFGSEINTPNIDKLGEGGIRFTQGYNCGRCCPTRASLITGLHPHQAGIGHMVDNLGHPAYQGYLREDCVTLAEILGEAGYTTCFAGKWHVGGFWPRRPEDSQKWIVGDPTRPLPIDRGFSRSYCNPAGGGSYFNPIPVFDQSQIVETSEGFYATDNYTQESIRMIEQAVADEMPFFLHLCFNAPHWPLHAWSDDIERYRGTYLKGWDALRTSRHEELKSSGILSRQWDISPRDNQAPSWEDVHLQEWEDIRMAVYAAQIDRMDQNIGRLVKGLAELGIADNTVIFFLSDNGGSAEFLAENGRREKEAPFTRDGHPVRIGNIPGLEPGGPETFMSYDLPWANASNAPFRLFKRWVHEGGISTPLIVYWPAVVKEGAIFHQPLHVIDIAATIIEIAGAQYPDEYNGKKIIPIEGESFSPLLFGRHWERSQPIYWEHEGNRAIRQGRWKLVSEYPKHWELYDMIDDRTELYDLSEKYPTTARDLEGLYTEWLVRCDVLPWDDIQQRRKALIG